MTNLICGTLISDTSFDTPCNPAIGAVLVRGSVGSLTVDSDTSREIILTRSDLLEMPEESNGFSGGPALPDSG